MTALTLRDILSFEVLGRAAPEVLSGAGALDRPVRWVHSGEVHEGASFLYGGELLLTNGFGLSGADAGGRRAYVRELAARGVAGVAVEVGRSLPDIPAEVVAESTRVDLPLVALRRVVPFVRIAEAVNTAIVALALAERTASRLRDIPGAAPVADREAYAAALLAELADGSEPSQAEALARAAQAGFRPGRGHRLLGLAARGLPTPVLERAARGAGGTVLAASFPGVVLALLSLPPSAGRDAVQAARQALYETRTPMAAAVGPAVPAEAPWARWGETLREARAALELSVGVPPAEPGRTRPGEPQITTARALALERELTRGTSPAGRRDHLAGLASGTLGPLLEWEATHPSDLVRTLEVHLRNGCSPTRTAALLHIGRQSLYQRLERIVGLLGRDITDPEAHAELLIAACAHRLLRAPG
ncbi:PucR family transcriptional regulator [Peterkaempfera sp. SMS 1(5)a]|uniref:PucR family transcriptional regulator n=1 Tax=Peterkaempfera podocarpi TaxID=3232308 RepID=UPI00366BA6D4